MGGEHYRALPALADLVGSSPHGRGALKDFPGIVITERIIPAWAGSTDGTAATSSPTQDHPRMGGEHTSPTGLAYIATGSSPHGRGAQLPTFPGPVFRRIIPAWAGSTSRNNLHFALPPDHPRMGGEHDCIAVYHGNDFGSSPHGRGARQITPAIRATSRIIPAWAGSTLRKRR